jgi:predicted TIM-barrel fold metal-dependent hydrolase
VLTRRLMALAFCLRLLAPMVASGQIGYKADADAERKKTLLLRDYHPQSMLHVKRTPVLRARFPVFDVHQHLNDARGIGTRMPPQEAVALMDRLNIQSVVILTGGWGSDLQELIDTMVKPYPGRFYVFTQIDWSKIDNPNFSQLMVQQLNDSVRRGARGLKILKELGLGVRDKSGKLVSIDDARLDPIWEECGRLGIPVAIHIADPEAFFHPIDGNNERYEELMEHPDWSFYGPQFPGLEELIAARDRMIAKHPGTTFVVLHVGNWPENLDNVEALLRKFPNVQIEFGARQAELGRQPRRTYRLFVDFQDRVMFGTDNSFEADLYQSYFRWLETDDEYFDYYDAPAQGRWKIYGLALPDPVLEKIYHLNAEKLFHQFKGTSLLSERGDN